MGILSKSDENDTWDTLFCSDERKLHPSHTSPDGPKKIRLQATTFSASARGERNWILVQGVSRRALSVNSCQLQSLQLPAAIKKSYFIAPVARNFQIFSRSRANRSKISFGDTRARKIVYFLLFIAFTCIMYSCML